MKSAIFEDLTTIYFGGGTPALLSPSQFEKLLTAFKTHTKNVKEITLEANPEDVSYEKMRGFKEAGINRISLGVQSFDEDLLVTLGRKHSKSITTEAIYTVAKAGITNISIDLMYDVPGQTFEKFSKTLEQIEKLPISHISLYNLTIEPGTRFHQKRDLLSKDLPSDEESLLMLELAIEKLTSMGFQRYEISAFAKKGKESNHNLGYWRARPFIGLGPSAFSYLEGSRFSNIAHLQKYQELALAGKDPVDFREMLSLRDHIKELLAIHLRPIEGVSLDRFTYIPEETLLALKKLESDGFVKRNNKHYRLTENGRNFYDTVASALI